MHKITGLLGFPLGHTLSPAMQNAAFKELGLDWEYKKFEVAPEDLKAAVDGFKAMHLAGFNVTIPHKEKIIPLLDDVTKLASLIGAVNTVKYQNGSLIGYNTDGEGFIASLKNDANESPAGKNIVVLGAGGAGRAVCVMLAENKASNLTISDIDQTKSAELAKHIRSNFKITCSSLLPNSPALQAAINSAHILVNTTPIGMLPKIDFSPIDETILLPSQLLVYDLVYNPAETKLIKQAKAAGCRTCSGLGMLVYQGAFAFTIWTGEEAPLEVMRAAAKKALGLS
ncbi:MAG: shikimate dehydrogenase [Candidatus Margulisiibacteriota bacterium]